MDAFYWVIPFLFYSVIFAVACSYIAAGKGKDSTTWAIIGFFLGVIGLLVIGLSEKEVGNPEELKKKCEQCAETVLAEAKICRFCGFKFPAIHTNNDATNNIGLYTGDFPEIDGNPVPIDWDDGIYRGSIVGGKPNGYGKWVTKEGVIYIGFWNNGLMHGKIRNLTKEGIIIDDLWLEGRRQYRKLN
jgi:hypothetical protein